MCTDPHGHTPASASSPVARSWLQYRLLWRTTREWSWTWRGGSPTLALSLSPVDRPHPPSPANSSVSVQLWIFFFIYLSIYDSKASNWPVRFKQQISARGGWSLFSGGSKNLPLFASLLSTVFLFSVQSGGPSVSLGCVQVWRFLSLAVVSALGLSSCPSAPCLLSSTSLSVTLYLLHLHL